jgi:hypothetical protein
MSCSASANISLTANPLPTVTLGAVNNVTNLCVGDTAHLYVSSCISCTYQWRMNGMAIPGTIATTCNATTAGTYNCLLANQYGCIDSSATPIVITTNPTPAVSVTATNAVYNHICYGDTANLFITAIPCNSCTYQWNINGQSIPGATSPSLTIDSAASYNCYVSNSTCTGFLASPYNLLVDSIPITAITPSTAAICTGDTITIKDTVSGFGLTYQWYMNYNQIMGNQDSIRVAGGFGATYMFKCFVTDNNGCWDSSNAAIIYDNQSPILPASGGNQVCIGDTLFLNITAYPSTCTYLWSGPNNFVSNQMAPIVTNAMAITDTGYYVLHATNNGCFSADSFLITAACLDSVWPGDVNYDHYVDNQDALDITLGYGYTGYARPGASISWVGQWCHDWNLQIVNGVNMKHGDCDGNDTVNALDTAAITANYGNYHPKQAIHTQPKITGQPDLYFDLTGINLSVGTSVNIPIKLGSASIPVNNITGMATKIMLSGINFTSAPQLSFANSWLGNNSNTYSFRKAVNNNRLDWAFARTDHQNISGTGTIATLTISIPANANPQNLIMQFADTRIINNAGQEITTVNIVDDTSLVSPTGIQQLENNKATITILPNPSTAEAVLQCVVVRDADVQMKLTNTLGQELWHFNTQLSAGLNQYELPQNLKPGIYLLSIKVGNQNPDVIRWIVQ